MLFKVKFNTRNKAFVVAAIITGISAGLLLEYHKRDPLNLYVTEKEPQDKLYNVAITVIAGGLMTYSALWAASFIFGYGDSALVL